MITRDEIKKLWRVMASVYGHKWVGTYGPDDEDDVWLLALSDLEPRELAVGLEACCKRRSDAWPPTLPEFRSLCRPAGYAERPQAYREFRPGRLLGQANDPEKARSAVKLMREIIHGRNAN